MPKVATSEELQDLARDLSALKAELMLCVTTLDVEALVDRYFEMGLWNRLRPAARELLSNIISRRMHEVEATQACGDVSAAMAEYDERAKLLAMARNMSR